MSALSRLLPLFFVLLWSTGFIGAKYGLPYAEPLTFLVTRYALVIALMTLVALAMRAPWPANAREAAHIAVTGLLLHGIYLSGVFISIDRGLPAGISALVVGMQPLLTGALAGLLLGERVSRRQWMGLALGFGGVALVVGSKASVDSLAPETLWHMVMPAVAALFGITAGTLYQKRFCPRFDLRTGSVVQFLPTLAVSAIIALNTETMHIEWTGDFIFALGWLVVVLSVGAVSLLGLLIRSGSAVNVASLFYLTPPATALIAWAMFDERLSALAIAGMGVAVGGVWLARKG
ncbi:DMT family transporter [Thauera sp. WH-2]|jgi:drug/metabolite transporter (DMT)-like permease|uniref:DMT family transporter n=1 Tax=Thauera sp. WH-2 TaxID=3401574 RepID=UPI003AAB9924